MEEKSNMTQEQRPIKLFGEHKIQLFLSPSVGADRLQQLFDVSWERKVTRCFDITHQQSLFYLVAKTGSEIVGYLNVPHDGKHHAFIVDLSVHPTYRRQGVALAMLQKALDVCRSNGYEWIHLDFNEGLTPLYEKAGFKIGPAGIIACKDS